MQSDLENQRHEQLRTFIKEMSGVLQMDIPTTCLGDFENFKQLVSVKVQRLHTKIELLASSKQISLQQDPRSLTQKL